MNAAVPPGWRPSFTAKQRRSIGSGAWARGRKRWGFFRVFLFPSFPAIGFLFFATPVLWVRTLVCLLGQRNALFCAYVSQLGLPALRPALHDVVITHVFYSTACLAALCCAAGFCFASITRRSGTAGAVECM